MAALFASGFFDASNATGSSPQGPFLVPDPAKSLLTPAQEEACSHVISYWVYALRIAKRDAFAQSLRGQFSAIPVQESLQQQQPWILDVQSAEIRQACADAGLAAADIPRVQESTALRYKSNGIIVLDVQDGAMNVKSRKTILSGWQKPSQRPVEPVLIF